MFWLLLLEHNLELFRESNDLFVYISACFRNVSLIREKLLPDSHQG